MKTVSFEVQNQKELKLLITFAESLGIKPVKGKIPESMLERVNSEISRARDNLNKDF